MRKLYIYTISLIVLALITMAYTAPPNDNVDLTLPTGYTAPANDNIDLVLDESISGVGAAGNITSTAATGLILNIYEDDDQ